MRRYEPKPWDIRRCDMVHADEGEYILYSDAKAEIERPQTAHSQPNPSPQLTAPAPDNAKNSGPNITSLLSGLCWKRLPRIRWRRWIAFRVGRPAHAVAPVVRRLLVLDNRPR